MEIKLLQMATLSKKVKTCNSFHIIICLREYLSKIQIISIDNWQSTTDKLSHMQLD